MYRLRNKLVCLFKLECLSKPVKMTDNANDTSSLQNLSIFRKLQVQNA